MRGPGELPPDRVGRDGWLCLRFARRGDVTILAESASAVPLQILAPLSLDDPAAVVSMLNPTGGVVGGDRLRVDITVADGAHACLTTPSATRIYRTAGPAAEQTVTLRVGAGAVLEWVPDHTIPFAGSAFRQSIDVEIAEGARLILVDAFAAGRVARAERWRFTELESAVRIRDARGWLLRDRFVLRAGQLDLEGLGFTEGAPYFATVAVLASGDSADVHRLVSALQAADGGPGCRIAAGSLPRRGAVARCLAGSAPALAAGLEALWSAARRALLGRPPLPLRKA